MLTNCLAAYAHLAITVSEIERDICEKIVILSYPLAFDAPVRGGFRQNIATPFRMEKLEWCGYPMVKKISKIQTDSQTDGQTDRQTLHDSIDRAYAWHRAVKIISKVTQGHWYLHCLLRYTILLYTVPFSRCYHLFISL